jgi:DNA-directed RNA polymerase delta subunit
MLSKIPMVRFGKKEEAAENEEDMRKILENLLTLSFEQEALMKEFQTIRPTDPRFVPLGQRQLKLRDDAQMVEDSLNALAKRVFEIKSFITREMAQMREHMEGATDGIKQRRPDIASTKQQLSMTSINNLALLLDDALRNMQENESQSQQSGGKPRMKKKKKPKPSPGNMTQLQKELNARVEKLKNGMKKGEGKGQGKGKETGKDGQQVSEELAQMAAQQEALRRALKQLENGQKQPGGQKPGGNLHNLQNLMEKTEQDLVNKRITQETILRQQEILTRLLEAETAMREREFDPKRESKTGKEINRTIPPEIEKYLKEKQAQIEMLNTLPPDLTPFYKQETGRYFQQLGGAPPKP